MLDKVIALMNRTAEFSVDTQAAGSRLARVATHSSLPKILSRGINIVGAGTVPIASPFIHKYFQRETTNILVGFGDKF